MAVAIVTGADSGIGKATAVLLAERGFDIGITWHTDEAGAGGGGRSWPRSTSRIPASRPRS
jgi:NAD(P)-dependent dehydrogenase (short-subunit alcohol dehydrogenase family)